MADAGAERDYSLFGDEHVAQYEATNGEAGYLWNGATCLVLRTKGRTTGEQRKFPLIYGERGDDVILVASKGGAPDHPGWYLNLVAHPDDVEVQIKGDVIPVHARTAEGAERRELWDVMLEQWPDYDGYQANTDREIPVVVLEPR
jgi:deazaflavin-dependent oxidoreductase (nitroreductase family)